MLNITIRETQIKTIVRYHLTSVTMAIITKSIKNKCWRRCGEKGTPLAQLATVQTDTVTMDNAWRLL